jgi:methylmalonyl-CoA mutase
VSLIRFGFDWIGALAESGDGPMLDYTIGADFATVIQSLVNQGYRGPFAAADARVIHNAGGSEAQELAFGVCQRAVLPADPGGARLYPRCRAPPDHFRLAADPDQLLTTAKFRALRKRGAWQIVRLQPIILNPGVGGLRRLRKSLIS